MCILTGFLVKNLFFQCYFLQISTNQLSNLFPDIITPDIIVDYSRPSFMAFFTSNSTNPHLILQISQGMIQRVWLEEYQLEDPIVCWDHWYSHISVTFQSVRFYEDLWDETYIQLTESITYLLVERRNGVME